MSISRIAAISWPQKGNNSFIYLRGHSKLRSSTWTWGHSLPNTYNRPLIVSINDWPTRCVLTGLVYSLRSVPYDQFESCVESLKNPAGRRLRLVHFVHGTVTLLHMCRNTLLTHLAALPTTVLLQSFMYCTRRLYHTLTVGVSPRLHTYVGNVLVVEKSSPMNKSFHEFVQLGKRISVGILLSNPTVIYSTFITRHEQSERCRSIPSERARY